MFNVGDFVRFRDDYGIVVNVESESVIVALFTHTATVTENELETVEQNNVDTTGSSTADTTRTVPSSLVSPVAPPSLPSPLGNV